MPSEAKTHISGLIIMSELPKPPSLKTRFDGNKPQVQHFRTLYLESVVASKQRLYPSLDIFMKLSGRINIFPTS